MKWRYRLVGVTILLLTWASAALEGQSSGDTVGYEPVNDSFALTLTEFLDPRWASAHDSGPSLFLVAETRRQYGCPLPLGISARSSAEGFDVFLAGISRNPTLCPGVIAPASGSVALPREVGTYRVVIRRPDGVQDTYQLRISHALTEVTVLAATYTTLTPTRRWRSRRNTLSMRCYLPWVKAAVDSTQSWVCTTFAAWLRDSLGMRPFRFGDGPALPLPGGAPPQQWGDVLYFGYDRAVDFRRSYTLLQRFSREFMASRAPNAWVGLTNWRGAGIDSYVCRSDQQWCQPSDVYPAW